ncbi:MAG TPA: hypothetical protein VFY18_04540 [Candidatus Limnocylindrales bacterium]|nr:hypothetical protein [Candidatus Limnocylindrales bacterium]
MTRSKTYLAAATMAILAMTSIALSTAVARPSDLTAAKAATGRFHSLAAAGSAGYGRPDAPAPLHECISHGADGAMGFHYIKGSLLDTTLDPTKPEALVYAPDADGKLHLAALEFVTFQAAWNADHPGEMPMLFGQEFMPVNAVPGSDLTVYAIPPFYMLHVWIWNDNPSGLFNPWNPSVSCAGAVAAGGSPAATLASAKVAQFACRIESNRA